MNDNLNAQQRSNLVDNIDTMIIGFSQSADTLMDIAKSEGSKLLIDTPDEKGRARDYLQRKIKFVGLCEDSDCLLKKDMMVDAVYQIISSPDRSFSVNPLVLPEFPVCSQSSRDCNRTLIPLPISIPVHTRMPIVSGAMMLNRIDYFSISPKKWDQIVDGLDGSAADAKAEKEQIRAVVDRFQESLETFFGTDDWPGWIGNLIPQRGEQDCVDETLSLISFFHALEAEGRLKYYTIPTVPIQSIPGYHNAFLIERRGSCERFVVDPWNGSTTILSVELWEQEFEYDRQYQQNAWSAPKF
jgi:hypothetical protein